MLSPDLLSLYTQAAMEELSECQRVKKIRKTFNNIRYAGDIVMKSDSKEKLLMLMDKVMLECSRIVLRINKEKAEVMGVPERREIFPVTISVEGIALKQVESFRYLGSMVCEDARCDKGISATIAIAKSNFRHMGNLLIFSYSPFCVLVFPS